jgi:hypothetical protein
MGRNCARGTAENRRYLSADGVRTALSGLRAQQLLAGSRFFDLVRDWPHPVE